MANAADGHAKSNTGIVIALVLLTVVLLYIFTPFGHSLATAVQPPVQVSLTPFLIFNGYYVEVRNTSTNTTLTDVIVKYTGSSGNTVSQFIGPLRAGEVMTCDPSKENWTVQKHESITVSAVGYLPKTLETDILIDK